MVIFNNNDVSFSEMKRIPAKDIPPGSPGWFTASQASKLVNVSKYGGPADYWKAYFGELVVEDNRRMEIGRDDEQINREVHLPKYLTMLGYDGEIMDLRNDFFHIPETVIGTHLDGWAKLDGYGEGPVEIKTTNSFIIKLVEKEGVARPDHLYQCLHQLLVFPQAPWVLLYYKAGTGETHSFVHRKDNQFLLGVLRETMDSFYKNHIVTKIIPEEQEK